MSTCVHSHYSFTATVWTILDCFFSILLSISWVTPEILILQTVPPEQTLLMLKSVGFHSGAVGPYRIGCKIQTQPSPPPWYTIYVKARSICGSFQIRILLCYPRDYFLLSWKCSRHHASLSVILCNLWQKNWGNSAGLSSDEFGPAPLKFFSCIHLLLPF